MSLLSLKHIHTYSPDRITLQNSTPIVPTNSEITSVWYFSPSKEELKLMYDNLKCLELVILKLLGPIQITPTIGAQQRVLMEDSLFKTRFNNGAQAEYYKSTSYYVRATRILISTNQYELGDETANGFIYHILDNLDGTFTYREAAKTDCASKSTWSNLFDLLGTDQLYFIGTTLPDLAEGLNNTNEIMAQVGHTTKVLH